MLLLTSDANILIDIEIGGLLAPMFSLDYRFAVPDVLFDEELEGQHRYLLRHGNWGTGTRRVDDRMHIPTHDCHLFRSRLPLIPVMIATP